MVSWGFRAVVGSLLFLLDEEKTMTLTFDAPSITVLLMIVSAGLMGLWHIGYLLRGIRWMSVRAWKTRAASGRLVSIPIFFGALGFYCLQVEFHVICVFSFIIAVVGMIMTIGVVADDSFWEGWG